MKPTNWLNWKNVWKVTRAEAKNGPMKYKNSKSPSAGMFRTASLVLHRMKQQYDNVKLRCLEHEQRIQQLVTLLNEKQILIDDLNHEKR